MAEILVVVGVRPQFVKLAALLPALKARFTVTVVHTGQHYDTELSSGFLEQLGLPAPDYELGVGAGDYGPQMGAMLEGLDHVLTQVRPSLVMVMGDANSTLAGALAASHRNIPLAHLEAGLRSFTAMPEERNRKLTDHLSSLLLVPGEEARRQLESEGLTSNVEVVGDVMLDLLRRLPLPAPCGDSPYLLLTVHRAENIENPHRLEALLRTLLARGERVLFPCHPRTHRAMAAAGWLQQLEEGPVELLPPLPYLEMMGRLKGARLLLTDSGGLQKEAYYLGIPCVTLRPSTEWVETVEQGWNLLVDCDPERLVRALDSFQPPTARPGLYGDGQAAAKVVAALASFLGKRSLVCADS